MTHSGDASASSLTLKAGIDCSPRAQVDRTLGVKLMNWHESASDGFPERRPRYDRPRRQRVQSRALDTAPRAP